VQVKRVLRWIGLLVVVVLALAAVGFGVAVVASSRELGARVAVVPPPLTLGHGNVERGKHLFNAVSSCVVCHRGDGGGGPFINDAAMALLNAPNLTRGNGGVGAQYSDADFDRAIRRGVRPDGTRLLIMPSWDYAAFGDDDAASVIAYIRSLPPVDRATPRVRLGPVGRILVATKKMPFDATRIADEGAPPTTVPPPMNMVEYGKYLARVGGCMGCHGAHLSGGHLAGPPDVPPAANITRTGIGTWSSADFMITITKGRDPSGHVLDPFMPWRTISQMTDPELEAIYDYLMSVPARPTGQG
jgi:mono/diheme cytochrome c family protein